MTIWPEPVSPGATANEQAGAVPIGCQVAPSSLLRQRRHSPLLAQSWLSAVVAYSAFPVVAGSASQSNVASRPDERSCQVAPPSALPTKRSPQMDCQQAARPYIHFPRDLMISLLLYWSPIRWRPLCR